MDAASFTESVDRLATNWIASRSDMECKNVRVVVISTTNTSKIRFNDAEVKIGTHGHQIYSFLLEIVMESSLKMKTKKTVQCYT